MPKQKKDFNIPKIIKYAAIIVALYLSITLPLYWYLKSSIDPDFIRKSEAFVHNEISLLPLQEGEQVITGKYSRINSYFYSRESSGGDVIDIELDWASPSAINYLVQYKIQGKLIIIHAEVGKSEAGELFIDSLWVE